MLIHQDLHEPSLRLHRTVWRNRSSHPSLEGGLHHQSPALGKLAGVGRPTDTGVKHARLGFRFISKTRGYRAHPTASITISVAG